jgi:hypothetical protein
MGDFKLNVAVDDWGRGSVREGVKLCIYGNNPLRKSKIAQNLLQCGLAFRQYWSLFPFEERTCCYLYYKFATAQNFKMMLIRGIHIQRSFKLELTFLMIHKQH